MDSVGRVAFKERAEKASSIRNYAFFHSVQLHYLTRHEGNITALIFFVTNYDTNDGSTTTLTGRTSSDSSQLRSRDYSILEDIRQSTLRHRIHCHVLIDV